MHCDINTGLQEVILRLEHLVEVGHLLVEVVDHLPIRRVFSEEDSRATTEGLCIEGVRRD